ncbi:hypothetical protein [Ereboglobus luteus]|uniref:Galactose oxidase n=1 Tax=Ereboglobus luteus TaxID=1796921 RepID=A0A2U8E1W3_9BACT|nr:hypothetical protein [Ereboglobus luteus]AWI08853.1 hypothetical protein CKA38_05935 [Ereboglobus luteus]
MIKKIPILMTWLAACGVCMLSCSRGEPRGAARNREYKQGVISWERVADLPDPVGLKGMFSGVSNGRIILAGGSNFPTPRNEGGKKTFSNRIFTCSPDKARGGGWVVDATVLPEGLGEGASVTTGLGVITIGGAGAHGASADVWLLQWDSAAAKVTRRALPSLPMPLANAAAACHQGKLYVAGGENAGKVSGTFYVIDIAAAADATVKTEWMQLPAWPGPARFGAVMAVLESDAGAALYMFGEGPNRAAP